MIDRFLFPELAKRLEFFPAVGLLGPRQVGKTTLALRLKEKTKNVVYLDLENPNDLMKLEDSIAFFASHREDLIILDEIHRKPDIFPILRGVIDENKRKGRANNQFLILGSASADLLRQSSESLAGRISYLDLTPIHALEFDSINQLWVRGGYPDSLLASSDELSQLWRYDFIQAYLERDIPLYGYRIPHETMRRLWTMLAHNHGGLFNASRISGALGDISNQTVMRYADLLSDLFMVRVLRPWYVNVGKRLIKSPKVYLRDSGLVHTLLNIRDMDSLLGHPIAGASWEGFVIDNLLSVLPSGSQAHFYRTARGAEIDLLIHHSDGRCIAIEIKKSLSPKPQRGFHEACKDIRPTYRFVVYSGEDRYPIREGVEVMGLLEMMRVIHEKQIAD